MAPIIEKTCINVAINGHQLSWLARTDGEDGAFIKANRKPGNCFVLTTAGGHRLAVGDGPRGAENVLQQGLRQWQQLSAAERRALPSGKEFSPPEAVRCAPPPGGLVVATFVRNLKRDASGQLARIIPEDLRRTELYPKWKPIYAEPARSNLWLTEDEWRSLVPARPTKGATSPVPEAIRRRTLRFHLVDDTYGLPRYWKPENILSGEMTLTVEEVEPLVRLRLRGSAVMATDDNPNKADHGYEAVLNGVLEYDPGRKAITRFDAVAVGDCWGGDWEGGRYKRPGRAPLGVAFRLVNGDKAVDRVPPLVFMDRKQTYEAYFER